MLTKFPSLHNLITKALILRHEMAWIVTGQALGFVGGFIGIKVLTTVMGAEGYGQLALGLTIAGLFNLFIYGPISNVVARFYSIYRERGNLAVYCAVLKTSHKVLALTLAVLCLAAGGLGWLLTGGEWGLLISVATLFGIASGINSSYVSLQSAMRDRKVVALHQGADVWIRIGLSILFLYLFQNKGYVALMGYLAGTLLITVSQDIFARKSPELAGQWNETAFSREAFGEFYRYAIPFVLWAGIAYVTMFGDRWILQTLFGEKEVGIYAALYQIANSPISIFYTMVGQLVTPIIFERAGTLTSRDQLRRSSLLLRRTVLVMVLFYSFTVALFYLFSDRLVALLTSREFGTHHTILWIIALSLSVFNIGQLLTTKGLYCNKPRIYLVPKIFQALSFVLFAFLLGTRYGVTGVAAALCLSSFVHLVLVMWANTRIGTDDYLSKAF